MESLGAKSRNREQAPDPAKYLKQQMLVMDSLEKSRDPEYQNKLMAEEKLKASKEKLEEFLNSTFNVSKSGINNEFNAFYKERKIALSKRLLTKITKVI